MTPSEHDLERLRRALALARKGRFEVEPNPPVGCVIERGDEGVVGEGWHGAYGGPHAEVVALERAGAAARGATAYVSLAPCGRHGKTPPCADALIAAGVARVVYAARDPDPAESDAGIDRLRAAGVAVAGPVAALDVPSEDLLGRFRASLAAARPWTVCKWAMSLDGRIAATRGAGGAISGTRARRLTHLWRAHADAVAVGVGTVLADDPRLTCRLAGGLPPGRSQPVRVVFDPELETSPGSRLVRDVAVAPVWLCARPHAAAARRAALEAAGCRVVEVPATDGGIDLAAALTRLRAQGVARLLVEGGARIHGALLRGGLVDQVTAFVAPLVFGAHDAVPAVEGTGWGAQDALRLEDVAWRRLEDDLLLRGFVPPAR